MAKMCRNRQLSKAGKIVERVKADGGLILIMVSDGKLSPALNGFLPFKLELTDRQSTSLQSKQNSEVGKYFSLPDLYFSELEGDHKIMKQGLSGDLVKQGKVVMDATNVDWSLFQTGENRKCAQVVLYEHLEKPSGAALVSIPLKNSQCWISSIDYKINGKETSVFWKALCKALKIKLNTDNDTNFDTQKKKQHDLLLDGPVEVK